jgi:DNA polymerase-1
VPDGYPGTGLLVSDFEISAFKCDEDESRTHPYAKFLRDLVKTVWYGLQYGKGGYGFGNSLLDADGSPVGQDKATAIVEGLLDAVPALRKYQDWIRLFIKRCHGIPGLAGRWCDLAIRTKSGDKWKFERAWRQALNFPMQSGGADIIGAAMVLVNRDRVLRELGFKVILQVHDELVLEGPVEHGDAAIVRVKQIMVECFPLWVALQVTAHKGKNWDEAK